jgi:hypothetical protein
VSLGGVAREDEDATEDKGTAIPGAAIPAVNAAEDLIKVLLLMFMMSIKKYRLLKLQR